MKRFKNILLAITDSMQNDTAIQTAVNLAQSNQANLTVIKVIEESNAITDFFLKHRAQDLLAEELKDKQAEIYDELASYRKNIDMNVIVVRGKDFYEIIHAVLLHGYDLVIKTCHHHGSLSTVVFGSTDMHLLRKCPCPVWLIKPQEEVKFKRILAAVDIQATIDEEKMETLNQQILEMATSLALSEFAELHIVHAWMIFGEGLMKSDRYGGLKEEVNEWLKQQKKEITAKRDSFSTNLHQLLGDKGSDYIQPEIHFINGDAIDVIPRISKEKNIDLVIMGTIARTGIPGILMGNTSENILNQLDCSVLAIKPNGFVSPVTV